MKIYNILVFPCGSEIGLEVYRSLSFSCHVKLIGASSVDDHGKFIYEKCISNLPFIDSDEIIPCLAKVVHDNCIDAIFPAMDSVISKLKHHEDELKCTVISSNAFTADICLSKSKTYEYFRTHVKVPIIYQSLKEISFYPVFIKPDVGYGSKGVFKANCEADVLNYFALNERKTFLITEYLPGSEFTVDCFTDKYGILRFVGPRIRSRISNGISVNTKPISNDFPFKEMAQKISRAITFRGSWFFQVKEDINGDLTLLEIAVRFGGSSGLYRNLGINFALLSVFDAFNIDVTIIQNSYEIELDRALANKFKTNLNYDTIYVDFDDCLIINDKVNTELVSFLFKSINENKYIILITKHNGDLPSAITKYRLASIFDEVIIIHNSDHKYKYLNRRNAIFIDDSYNERKLIYEKLKIPVFSPDMIESLL